MKRLYNSYLFPIFLSGYITLIKLYHSLVFHTVDEFFSIAFSLAVFILFWNVPEIKEQQKYCPYCKHICRG